jgi:hypothetical protein
MKAKIWLTEASVKALTQSELAVSFPAYNYSAFTAKEFLIVPADEAALAAEKAPLPADEGLRGKIEILAEKYKDEDNLVEGFIWGDEVATDLEESLRRHPHPTKEENKETK